jgi:hypothetical protein
VVHSGTISGVLQVLATVVSPSGLTKSTPVRILINAGLPSQNWFSVGPTSVNVWGWDHLGNLDTINVLVGDKYGNPVAPNTAVYFTTRIGVVTTNTGFTDINGQASVILITGNPKPASGFGEVVARTVGENGVTVSDSTLILFSGHPVVANLVMSNGGVVDSLNSVTVTFRAYDNNVNHNPLVAGTKVTVVAEGASVTVSTVQPGGGLLPDTQDPYWTTFRAVISKGSATPGTFTITVSASGPSGSDSQQISGVVQ